MFVIPSKALSFRLKWRNLAVLILRILAHTSVDAFNPSEFFLSAVVRGASNIPFPIAFGPVALLLMIFTRGRLGYQHSLQEAEPDKGLRTTRA